MAKKNVPMSPRDAAKSAAKMARRESPQRIGKSLSGERRVNASTAKLTRKNTRGGKLTLGDKVMLSGALTSGSAGSGTFKSKSEYKAAKIMQSRRGSETSRTASRAKGISARQTLKAKSRRGARGLGN